MKKATEELRFFMHKNGVFEMSSFFELSWARILVSICDHVVAVCMRVPAPVNEVHGAQGAARLTVECVPDGVPVGACGQACSRLTHHFIRRHVRGSVVQTRSAHQSV